jgi:hypothetical protein
MKYRISQNEAFTGRPDLIVEYEGDPPCLFCNRPVKSPSSDGPLICPMCDMGCNEDGTAWTREENETHHANFSRRIQEIRANQ